MRDIFLLLHMRDIFYISGDLRLSTKLSSKIIWAVKA